MRVVGWVFWAVGATLYVAAGLLYGYRAIVWVSRRRDEAGEGGRGSPA